MKPCISVIIPIYNIENYISDCVSSVQKQTHKNLEIILVDDGSTDGSGLICDNLKRIDARIKIFHTKNGGLSAARNFGLKKCTGDFVTFVDGDDTVTKNYVEYLYKLIQKNNADMSICSFRIKTEGTEKNFAKEDAKEELLDTKTCLEKMLLEDGFNVSACGKLFPKKLYRYLSFPVGKLHEDVGATYVPILHCKSIAFGPSPNYIYHQRKSSITHNFTEQKLDLIELTDKMCDDIQTKYPELTNVLDVRRMHARFSVLRQLPSSQKNLQNELVAYLKEKKNLILKNPKASKRDKLAILSLLCGLKSFQLSWHLYESFLK